MKNENANKIIVGCTTVSSKKDALLIVRELVYSKLIACGQIDGPILSVYQWKEKLVEEREWKISLKFAQNNSIEVFKKIKVIHPYETPQWVCWDVLASKEFKTWVCGGAPQ